MTSFIASLLSPILAAPTGTPEPTALPKSPDSPYFWMPTRSSTVADQIDWLFDVLVWLSVLSCIGIMGAMVYFCIKYRAKSRAANERVEITPDHNTTLEITWSFVPLVILIALFVWGFKGYVDLRTVPKDAMQVHVSGQKWKWNFTYSNGWSDDVLHVPVDTPVKILLNSTDVLHSFFVPAFRVKIDAVPGRYTELWFHATETGEFPIECTEYCGTSHSDMLSKVIVHPPGGYEKYLEQAEEKEKTLPPAELGAQLYSKKGCKQCHSIDGSRLIGPTWKGIFGKSEPLADGSTAQVDENYLRESIVDPQVKLVQGYPPSMPTYKGQLKDHQLTALIEYIKTLK
jgi:cytochrome c oxidase subunit 2